MKLTPEQLLEKKARENIKRLINRVSSEYSFKKWRNLHSYLRSIGADVVGADKELTRPELDELLRQYEENAFKQLAITSPTIKEAIQAIETKDSSSNGLLPGRHDDNQVSSVEEKFTEKNNYGLSKSSKESVVLFWFQKLASANLLKGFDIK